MTLLPCSARLHVAVPPEPHTFDRHGREVDLVPLIHEAEMLQRRAHEERCAVCREGRA